MAKKQSLIRQYQLGIRNDETKEAWADYIREGEYSKKHMRKQYNDPNSDVKPLIMLRSAIQRTQKMGGWIDDSPEDFEKQLEFYREVHRRNLRDGKGTWSVDHIWEICNKGPHCSSNLRIITMTENVRKSIAERKRKGEH